MRKGDGAQNRIAHWCVIHLHNGALPQGMRVMKTESHEEIVRVVGIHQRLSVRSLTRMKKFGVAAIRDGGRIKTEHHLEHEASAGKVVAGREHAPIRRIKLVMTARTGLLRVDQESLTHEHKTPVR